MTKPTVCDEPTFDVFLSHNSRDKPAVRQLMAMVAQHELSVWLDEDQLQPGIPWQPLLERGIKNSRSVAVLVGSDDVGPWENEEMRAALALAVRDGRPVIPVLLPGSTTPPELPLFLANRTWVDLRGGWNEEGLAKLVWGITGRKPVAVSPMTEAKAQERSVDSRPSETMARDELLTRLQHLLSSQFEEVLFRANIPPQHLSASTAPLTTRAVEAFRYMEQLGRLDQLARLVRQVAGHGSPADPR